MVRLRNIERVIFPITFIAILLFACGQCRKREENTRSIEGVCADIPCWNQSWKSGQWKSVNGSMKRGESICISTGDPNSDMVYFSVCALCDSMYVRDPVGHKERIILTSKGLKYHCEHKWRAAFRKVSIENIESGDILLLVYKKAMYCVKIEEILSLIEQGIRYQIAQVAPEDIRLHKIDLKKLIWREKKANRAIPISSRMVPFRLELFENEEVGRPIHIEYDQYFASSGGPESEADEESIHIAIVHKQEVANDNIVDLGKFRFKVWEDGLGNRCDRIDSRKQEYEKEIVYWDLHNGGIRDIGSAVDNSYLVIIGNDKRVILKHLDLPMEKSIGPFPLVDRLSAIAASEDGATILVSGDPDILKINALYGTYETFSKPFSGTIRNICYYDRDESIAYITVANELIFFNLKTNRLISSHKIYGSFVEYASISPDKNFFATVSTTLSMNEVDLKSSEPCKLTIFDQKGEEILSHVFDKCEDIYLGQIIFSSPDCLSLCLRTGEMYQWRLTPIEHKWELKEKVKIPAGPFFAIERSPDGTIIWLSKDLSVVAINSSSGELLYEYTFDDKVVQPPIRVIRLIANRGILAVGFENGYIALLKVPEQFMSNVQK